MSKSARRRPSSKAPPPSLESLRREHDALLAKIAKKKIELERLAAQAHDRRRQIARRLEPLWAELESLAGEIRKLFAELLTPGRLTRQARTEVKAIHREVYGSGGLPADDDDEPRSHDAEPDDDSLPPSHAGGYSAPRPDDDGRPIESIRDIYRRLASAVHPDKVQDEAEKARRTEVMKDVTVAYGRGDLARLLDIERRWSALSPGADLQALARLNDELRRQLAALVRELRDRKDEPVPAVDALVDEAKVDLAYLRTVVHHLRSFGKSRRPRAKGTRRASL